MAVTDPFFGLRTTADWEENQFPENWREGLLWLYPNGDAPLTAILSLMRNSTIPKFDVSWYIDRMASRGGTLTGVYTDSGLSSAYVSGGVAGQTLYIKMKASSTTYSDALIGHFKVGSTASIGKELDPTLWVVALVTQTVSNGASSYIRITLLEADDNSVNGFTLANADEVWISGSAYGEAGMPPEATNVIPFKFTNQTQILKTTIELSGTTLASKMRPMEALDYERKKKLEDHGRDIEEAILTGVYYEDTDDDGNIRRFMRGLLSFLKTYASTNIMDFRYDTDFGGMSWLEGGEDWLDNAIEHISLWSSAPERLGLCGNSFLMGLNRLIKHKGLVPLTSMTMAYGIKVTRWETPVGDIYLKRHPLFNLKASYRRSCLILDPRDLVYDTLEGRDFKIEDVTTKGFDGVQEQFLSEATVELSNVDQMGLLNGVGSDSLVNV